MRSSVVVAAVAALAVSCASEQVRWGEETATTAAAPSTTADEPAKPKTAAEYAARFPTDGACEAEARRIDGKSRELALKLLDACIERGDFKRMNALVDAPWTAGLRDLPQAQEWCARVVAARAGDIDADVRACAAVGLKVKTLEQLFTDPNTAKGSVVVFRARVDTTARPKRDTRLIETALDEGEVESSATGRRVSATFGTHRIPARDGVVLARALRLAEDKDADDGEPVAVVEVLGSFPAAARPTYN